MSAWAFRLDLIALSICQNLLQFYIRTDCKTMHERIFNHGNAIAWYGHLQMRRFRPTHAAYDVHKQTLNILLSFSFVRWISFRWQVPFQFQIKRIQCEHSLLYAWSVSWILPNTIWYNSKCVSEYMHAYFEWGFECIVNRSVAHTIARNQIDSNEFRCNWNWNVH